MLILFIERQGSFSKRITLPLTLCFYSLIKSSEDLLDAFQTISHLIILSYLQKLDIEKKLQRLKTLWKLFKEVFWSLSEWIKAQGKS